MAIRNCGYVLVEATDLAAWRSFGVDVVGAMEVPAPENAVALKIDDHPFRVFAEQADTDRLAAIGLEMTDSAAYAAMGKRLAAQGLDVRQGDAAGAAQRCVTEFFSVPDPMGNRVEFYHARTGCGTAFSSPAGVSGFVTGDMGLGHIVLAAPGRQEAAYRFYTDILGLAESDDLTIAPMSDAMPEIRVNFLHADNPRHHVVALANLPSPTGVVHLMLEMANVDDVGACLDRVLGKGWSLMATLGRHCNDHMLSFYANGPGGIPLEIGCEGLQIDWSGFAPTTSTVPDFWGHAYQIGSDATG